MEGLCAQTNQKSLSYKALRSSILEANVNPDSILSCFIKADESMEIDRYDSAEYWLGIVGNRLSLKKPGIFNYYYHSRQSEVFYYNDILQLGSQQAQRALIIAQELGDSLFLADAYNLLGLFSLNLEKYGDAEKYLIKGLNHLVGSPERQPLLPLSKAYHIHGNLGEVYTKLMLYDDAIVQFRHSIEKAQKENVLRPQALALISLGEVFFLQGLYDPALKNLGEGALKALENKDYDVALYGYGVLAMTYANKGLFKQSKKWIEKGKLLQREHPQLNPFYTLLYMRRATSALTLMKDFEAVSVVQKQIMDLEEDVRQKNNIMMENVLSVGFKNENRLLQIEINESRDRQKENSIRIAGLLVIIVLMALAGLYYRNSVQQKLRLASMREKISQNLHDDIGASISSLHIYSTLAQDLLPKQLHKVAGLLEKISEQSSRLMENMNDMVWSMRTDKDVMPLSLRIKNYGFELLSVKEIKVNYEIDENLFVLFKGFEERKNILLIIKEAMNNIAKYSHATVAAVKFARISEKLAMLSISDNGIGFDVESPANGNGLKNMETRAKILNGRFHIYSFPNKGTNIEVKLPIP